MYWVVGAFCHHLFGFLLRAYIISPSSYRPVIIFRSCIILLLPPHLTRCNDVDISAGGAINDCEGKLSLLLPLIVIVVYGKLGAGC